MAERLGRDRDWVREEGMDLFHAYSFATLRQCGATAELAASLCGWLDVHADGVGSATEAFGRVATAAKAAQFKLARLASGREVDIEPLVADIALDWDHAICQLVERYG